MNEQDTALVLLLILCFSVVSISEIGTVKAENAIYIRADGSVEGTDKIQREGNLYTFTQGIFDSIVVEKNDVVLDGAGCTLNGTGIGIGINLTERTNVTIGNMRIYGFEDGIHLLASSMNRIYGNRIATNGNGIYLEASSNNSIYENFIMNNSIGITITGGKNTILDNVIAYNREYGINLEGASYNIFFRNDIIDNNQQVHCVFGASNIYDNDSVGNYWSDYNGTDADNDGIGDQPYFISVTNIGYELNDTDNYPLMEPTIIPEFPLWAILPLFLITTLLAIFTKKKTFHLLV
jgi:parallel beta-helix repeat protein